MSFSDDLMPSTSPKDIESRKSDDDTPSKCTDIEKSRPPTPQGEGLPTNFGEVMPGVYRSSFPLQPHLKALSKLALKTIITLVDEEYPPEYLEFIQENGICHHQIHIVANKDPAVYASTETVVRALKIILDAESHPVLIHCNKGKHRTGCIVACLRRAQGWSLEDAIAEYLYYSEPKSRSLDRSFITEFDIPGALLTLVTEVDVQNVVRFLGIEALCESGGDYMTDNEVVETQYVTNMARVAPRFAP